MAKRFPPYPRSPHSSGRARILLPLGSGKRRAVYLDGPHGSEESQKHYARLFAEHSGGTHPPSLPRRAKHITIASLCAAYIEHADGYYPGSSEPRDIRESVKPMLALFADTLAEDFGPSHLRALREAMYDGSWMTDAIRKKRQKHKRVGVARKVGNQRIARVVRMFRWAASHEMLPAEVWAKLKAVECVRKGRHPRAREYETIPPVPVKIVARTLKGLTPATAAMVRVQLLTGMRPKEVCRLTAEQVDQAGPIVDGVRLWVYRPSQHKTSHHGHFRQIAIGPRAQRILARFVDLHPDGFLFRPKGHGRRKDHFTTSDYDKRIARACKALGLPHWAPNQLRHTAATVIEERMGLDASRAALGHRSQNMTKVYAAGDLAIAAAVAAKRG